MSFALSYMVSYYEGHCANISIVSVKMQAKCVVTSFGDLSCLTCLININPRFSCNYKEYSTSYCSLTPKNITFLQASFDMFKLNL